MALSLDLLLEPLRSLLYIKKIFRRVYLLVLI